MGQHYVLAGAEARIGEVVVGARHAPGLCRTRHGRGSGTRSTRLFRRPRVAILSTGDEVVEVDQTPGPFQIRNSNTISLSAQVALAGGEPVPLLNARDDV